MSSTYSPLLRLDFQAPGDNLNTWGLVLNSGVFALLETAIAGRIAFTLSGSKTLTTGNGSTDEARNAILDITGGTGGTVTIPSLSKPYIVRNATTGNVIITTGAGATTTVAAGNLALTFCDGSNVYAVQQRDFGGSRLTNVGSPTADNDAANRAFVVAQAFATQIGDYPGLPGNAGKALVVSQDETTVAWAASVQFKTADFTCDRNASYSIDTTAGVVTATLPASPVDGDRVGLGDQLRLSGGFSANRLVVARNGKTIMGLTEDMNVRIRNMQFALSYHATDGDWRFTP